jgi:hypothetical protein
VSEEGRRKMFRGSEKVKIKTEFSGPSSVNWILVWWAHITNSGHSQSYSKLSLANYSDLKNPTTFL